MRDRRPGHDPRRLPGPDRDRRRLARGDLFDDRQLRLASAEVGCPQRVAVHHRLVERRHVEIADDVLRQHQAQRRRRQRRGFRGQQAHLVEHDFQSFRDAEHGMILSRSRITCLDGVCQSSTLTRMLR